MRRITTLAAVCAAAVALPATAEAHSQHLRHENHVLRAKVIKLGGSPGRDIITQGRRPGKDASVKQYMATLRRMARPVPIAPVVTPATATAAANLSYSAAAPAASTAGGCGDLPAYIVERESGGDPNARNGRYGGCAQVDDAHFAPGGACAGMTYIDCVNHLWDDGRGASNWPTAASPLVG